MSILHTNGNKNAYVCLCPSKAEHPVDCQCKCGYCKAQRSCSCVSSAICRCPVMCNCNCDDCHKYARKGIKSETDEEPDIKPKPKASSHTIKAGGEDRKCITEGCDNVAPVNGQSGVRCKACYKKSSQNRRCATPGCNNNAPIGSPHGRYCKSCARRNGSQSDAANLRKCQTEGCDGPAPVGGASGKYCGKCRTGKVTKKVK